MSKKTKSYAKGSTKTPLIELTIGDMLDKTTKLYPDNDAIVVAHQNLRYTYKELNTQVNICARALIAMGLKKGERIGIWSLNNAQWVIFQLATSKVGLILVNINPAYRFHELEYTLKHSGCSTVVVAQKYKNSDYIQMINQLEREKIPNLKNIIHLGDEKIEGMTNWNDFMSKARQITQNELDTIQKSLNPHDAINIQYTSGTTGFPKGATLSHHNILNNGYFVGKIMNFTNKDRLIIPVPLYHCFGMVLGVLTSISHGATMLFPSMSFNPKATLDMAHKEKATALHGVPTMFISELELLEHHDYDLRTLRTGVIAGAPCPPELMKQINSLLHMSEVEIACGLTEVSPINTQTTIDAPFEKRIGTVGQVHPHVEIKIIDTKTNKIVPINTMGEICTRGYSVMLGYWNDEQKTKETIDEDGWLHSGDLATMDEDGYVSIVGRIKDMIIRGGENIYPREIEEFYYNHPKIRDIHVIGIANEKLGEELVAWVRLKDGETLTTHELKEFAKDKIAYFKIPKYFKFVDSFPMTVTGKVQKFIMREQSINTIQINL